MRCSDIFGFTQIADAAISPAGDAVAFVRRTANADLDGYEWELLVARLPGMDYPGVAGSLGTGLRKPAWAPDGRRLAALERRRGESTASVVVVSAVDGTRRSLVTGAVEPADAAWSPDGREIGFLAISAAGSAGPAAASPGAPFRAASGSPAAPVVITTLSEKIDGLGLAGSRSRHLFAVACDTGVVRQLTRGDLWVDDFCYSPSGLIACCGSGPWSARVPRQPGAVRPAALWLVSSHGGAARQLAAPEASARCPVFVTDEQVAFVGLAGLGAELPGLFAVAADGGQVRRLAAGLDRGLVVGSAGFQGGHRPVAAPHGELLFCARDGGCVQLYRTSLRSPAAARAVAGSASESIGAVSASRAGDRLGYVSSTADGRQRLMVLEPASGRRTVLAEMVPPGEAVPAAPVEFTARDGLKLAGWLIRRGGRGRTPLLVDVHGGSFSGAWSPLLRPSRLYQQELAAEGWTILLLNARGSDGYGSDFARAAVGAWGEADAPDFHDAIDTLIGKGLVDPARLAVTGYSYGGFMSNWLTATSDRFSAAVAGGSICDFVSLFGTSDMGWNMSEYDIRVRPDLDPLGALRRSPIGLGRPVRTPTLLLHGEADLRCPISQAEEWLALLLSTGCEASLVRYPAASHGFLTQGPPSMAADYGSRLVDWVNAHVSGGPPRPAAATPAGP
jgi:dipeptidyl aminopeptidase/acylaminoacyl peptidase